MHPRPIITTLFTLTAIAACGGKSDAPAGTSGPSSAGASEAGEKLTLEKNQAAAAALAELGQGWEKGMDKVTADDIFLSFKGPKNDSEAYVNIVMTGMNCMLGICAELTADAWKKNEENLKGKLSQVLKESPDLVFEISETEVAGKKAIAIYALAFFSEEVAGGGTSRVSTHSYDLYWHDGAKFVNLQTNAGGTGAQSRDELAAKVTREELETVAKQALGLVLAKL
jgi:hypothetical protein